MNGLNHRTFSTRKIRDESFWPGLSENSNHWSSCFYTASALASVFQIDDLQTFWNSKQRTLKGMGRCLDTYNVRVRNRGTRCNQTFSVAYYIDQFSQAIQWLLLEMVWKANEESTWSTPLLEKLSSRERVRSGEWNFECFSWPTWKSTGLLKIASIEVYGPRTPPP